MPIFYYRARDHKGSLNRGQIEASDIRECKKKIFELGLLPVAVSSTPQKSILETVKETSSRLFQRVTLDEILVFNQQFLIIYSVGIPLLRGLELIEVQTENRYFKKIIRRIIRDVREGEALDVAFSRHPDVFDSTYVNLIKSGAASGNLDKILARISQLTEQKVENIQRIKSATFYPKMVCFFLVVVFFVVIYLVIPKLKGFYDQFNAELPLITRIAVKLSDFMLSYWYLIIFLAVGAVWGIKKILSTSRGRIAWDRFQLKLPVFGKLFRQIESASYCVVLDLLIEGGVAIVDALNLTRDSLGNSVFKREVEKFSRDVEKGGKLSESMIQSKEFPPMIGNLVTVGEEAGALSVVLNQVGKYYQIQINYRLANLSKTIEPFLLVIIFAAVLALALTVFLPMWQMSSAIRR